MKTIIITRKAIFLLAVFGALFPVFGSESLSNSADRRNTPITVNLIVDGTAELANTLEEVEAWISANLIDKFLQNGDQMSIWSAGATAQSLYSDTVRSENDKESIRNIIRTLPTRGNFADFAGALRSASASQNRNRMSYTVLITASPAVHSPTLSNLGADLIRFSRVEEHRGWRVLVVGLDINSRVQQAASAYLSGR